MKERLPNSFIVPRRYAGTPWELAAHRLPLCRRWYQTLTSFDRAVGYALFALTEPKNPSGWQEVRTRDILELIRVQRYERDQKSVFHGEHYRKTFLALEKLFNTELPLKVKSKVTEDRKSKIESRFESIRLIQELRPVYRNKNGSIIDLTDERLANVRVDIGQSERPVYAMVKMKDKQIVRDSAGNAIPKTPLGYRFRWHPEMATDLIVAQTRRRTRNGWLKLPFDIFDVLRDLRTKNDSTALRLFELVISDIMPRGTLKPAKLIFGALGFPKPGRVGKVHVKDKDGRWTENVNRVAKAVRSLKTAGVLLDESTEEPISSPAGQHYCLMRVSARAVPEEKNE